MSYVTKSTTASLQLPLTVKIATQASWCREDRRNILHIMVRPTHTSYN